MAISTSTNFNLKINGKDYKSIEDFPPNLRKYLEDKNNNGQIDYVENLLKKVITPNSANSITINGKKYNSWSEVPQGQQKLQQVFDQMKTMGKTAKEQVEYNPSEQPAFSQDQIDNSPIQVEAYDTKQELLIDNPALQNIKKIIAAGVLILAALAYLYVTR